MTKFYSFIGKYLPEIIALSSSALAFVSGIYLGNNFDIMWLNRAGALITIVAIMLAASRFHDEVANESLEYLKRNHSAYSLPALDEFEKENGVALSDDEHHIYALRIKNIILENLNNKQWCVDYVSSIIEPGKRRIKVLEFYLACFGTFLNGFGDYFLNLLKELAS
ncbi:hypothetical protein [Methylomonas sp. 11b]|uniref:hypothetical protein n=1 Tax=Methylomonas sp. 11b TaxID=1168169 RepID=UPI00047A8EAF|nr:hypothetical protein [Methylomonas sp. 11b]